MSDQTNPTQTALATTAPAALQPSAPPPSDLVPRSLQEVREVSQWLAGSSLIPKQLQGKPDDVAIVILTGIELGIGPMTALRMIAVVNGRPVLEAELVAGRVLQCKHVCDEFGIVEATPKRATVQAKRPEWREPRQISFTIEEAQAAGLLGKDNWKCYPTDMLCARAKARACRQWFPDVTMGFATPDEVDEIRASSQNQGITARERPISVSAAPAVMLDVNDRVAEFERRIDATATRKEYNDVAAEIAASDLPVNVAGPLRKRWADHKPVIDAAEKAAKAPAKAPPPAEAPPPPPATAPAAEPRGARVHADHVSGADAVAGEIGGEKKGKKRERGPQASGIYEGETAKCDGQHAEPACADPHCWLTGDREPGQD